MSECNHKYIHFDTSKRSEHDGSPYQLHWIRVDKFFCEKCLDTKDVKKEGWDRDKPDWY